MNKINPLRSFLFLGITLMLSAKLLNAVEGYPSWMTYRNMDVAGKTNFINYLAPGVKDSISKTSYKFSAKKKIHWSILLGVVLFMFPLLLFARTYKSLDLKLGIKSWLTGWLTFVAARVGVLRVTGVCPVKRSGLGIFPFINCQSCELATGACPVGTFQMSLLNGKIPFLTISVIILTGALLGRWVCAWVCPFGFLSDIFNRFSKHKKLPKKLGYAKYVILALFILSSVFILTSSKMKFLPFCTIFCAGGFLYGLLPYYVTTGFSGIKRGVPFFHILVIFHIFWAIGYLVACYKYSGRFFCKYICPMGATLGLFNKIAFVSVSHDKNKCSSCGACSKVCQMEADLCRGSFIDRTNCISCARCIKVCPSGARYWKFDTKALLGDIKTKEETNKKSTKTKSFMKAG
jgi:ferredoxin